MCTQSSENSNIPVLAIISCIVSKMDNNAKFSEASLILSYITLIMDVKREEKAEGEIRTRLEPRSSHSLCEYSDRIA